MTSGFADNELAAFLDDLNAQRLSSAAEPEPAALRQASRERAAARPKGPEMHAVLGLFAPPDGRPARLYRPTPGDTPLALYLHGGGWVIGDLETHDRACRRLAFSSGVSVLALDYRRAPEHPWPAAVDDAVAALRWIASQPCELEIAPTAVAIAGDSAGGTTAALACGRVRDEAPEALPRAQVLIYANTDLGNSGASMCEKGRGFGLRLRISSGSTRSGFPTARCSPIRESVRCSSQICPVFPPRSSSPASTTHFETRVRPTPSVAGSRRSNHRAPRAGLGPQLHALRHHLAGVCGSR
jgi:acetyl esterase/lipase